MTLPLCGCNQRKGLKFTEEQKVHAYLLRIEELYNGQKPKNAYDSQ